MDKFISALIMLSAISLPALAADDVKRDNPSPQSAYGAAQIPKYAASDPGFAIVDIIILRPISLAVTAAGAALFAATSPLTALASIPRPHNAFYTSFKVLIAMPAAYTFVRPVGDKTLLTYNAKYGNQQAFDQSTRY